MTRTKPSRLASTLTYEQMKDIRLYAPKEIPLTEAFYQHPELQQLDTIGDFYEIFHALTGGHQQEFKVLKVKADGLVLKEVHQLSKDLMAKALNAGEHARDIQQALKVILDYQEELQQEIDRNNHLLDTERVNGSGYLLFRDLSDEELEHFWNEE